MSERKRSGASGSEKRQRAYVVTVRVNGAEREELTRRADRAGLSIPSFVRHQVLDVAPPRQRPRPTVETAMLARLLGQISQMGGAVNDIAVAYRRSLYLPTSELRALERLHTDLNQWGAELLRAMGRSDGGDNDY